MGEKDGTSNDETESTTIFREGKEGDQGWRKNATGVHEGPKKGTKDFIIRYRLKVGMTIRKGPSLKKSQKT